MALPSQTRWACGIPLGLHRAGRGYAVHGFEQQAAIQVNIQIMRAFTRLRQMLATHEDLQRKIEDMESKYDEQFRVVFEALRQLLATEEKAERKIGFVREESRRFGSAATTGQGEPVC